LDCRYTIPSLQEHGPLRAYFKVHQLVPLAFQS
jgi:hypothetical protein